MAAKFIPTMEQDEVLTHVSDESGEHMVPIDSNSVVIPAPEDITGQLFIKRTEILDFGNEGFLLHGVLSSDECCHYITEGEKLGFGAIEGARPNYRNSQRIIFKSKELADLLWKRVNEYVDEIKIQGDPHNIHIHGVEPLLQGTWKPSHFNNIFRLCRYYPGGHFAPHFDGHLVNSSEERSMKTLMLYLNDGFSGGTTNFVDESQELYKDESGKYCAEEKNILCRIHPEAGLAVIFNHHRLHEGSALGDGVKYILRTDVMYHRLEKTECDDTDEKAFQLVQEAERLEAVTTVFILEHSLSMSLASFLIDFASRLRQGKGTGLQQHTPTHMAWNRFAFKSELVKKLQNYTFSLYIDQATNSATDRMLNI